MSSLQIQLYSDHQKNNPFYPNIMHDYKLSYYDLSKMVKDNNGVYIGEYKKLTKDHIGILQDPKTVLNDALRLYTINGILFANGYDYKLYDNLKGWASNVDDDYLPLPP